MTPHKCPVCEGKGIRPDDSEDCFACDASGIVWAKEGGEPQKQVIEHHYHYHGGYPWTFTTGTSTTGYLDTADGTTSAGATWTNVPYATVTAT